MNLTAIAGDTVEALVQQLQGTVARINTVFGKEHLADGKHAIPALRDCRADVGASNFASQSGQTWTVSAADILTFQLWKHANTCHLNFYFFDTTIGGAASNLLVFDIPYGITPKDHLVNPIYLTDGNIGLAVLQANDPRVFIARSDFGNFAGGSTSMSGHIEFRTTS